MIDCNRGLGCQADDQHYIELYCFSPQSPLGPWSLGWKGKKTEIRTNHCPDCPSLTTTCLTSQHCPAWFNRELTAAKGQTLGQNMEQSRASLAKRALGGVRGGLS